MNFFRDRFQGLFLDLELGLEVFVLEIDLHLYSFKFISTLAFFMQVKKYDDKKSQQQKSNCTGYDCGIDFFLTVAHNSPIEIQVYKTSIRLLLIAFVSFLICVIP